jgi:5-formyltetrahydrofolate cyclo-ligase
MREIKDSIRKELLKKRDGVPLEVRQVKDRMIHEHLRSLPEFRNANAVFFFASFRSEVDTYKLIKEALDSKKRAVLPKVDLDKRSLLLYEILSLDELKPGYMGIPEPSVITEDRFFDVNDVDIVIIPGVGFDELGHRIGYGAGYYDLLLSVVRKTVAIVAPAYEEQMVEKIPSETHDIKVSMIVTDRRLIKCSLQESA